MAIAGPGGQHGGDGNTAAQRRAEQRAEQRRREREQQQAREQRAQARFNWRLNQEQQRQHQANRYNHRVQAFENSLGHWGNRISGLSRDVSGLGIADLDDSTFSNFNSRIGDKQSSISGLSVGMSRPSWPSQVNSPFGVVPLGIPHLRPAPDTGAANQLVGNLDSISSQLSGLRDQRQQEEQRVNAFRDEMMGNVGMTGQNIANLGIGDEFGLRQAEQDLNFAESRLGSFRSPILGQVGGFGGVEDQISSLSGTLGELQDQRAQELERVDDFRGGLFTANDAFRDQLDGLTIADPDQFREVGSSIDDQLMQINRFDSPLDPDFGTVQLESEQLRRQVDDLQNRREAEQDRIERSQGRFQDMARGAGRAADRSTIYSLPGLDAIDDQISSVGNEISGFDSLLDTDFSTSQGLLSDARTTLEGLRDERQQALDGILAQTSGPVQGLEDVALYDEPEFRDRLDQVRGIDSELARFSGGRVDEIQAQVDASRAQIDGRLQELSDFRAQLQEQAQALLENVQGSTYFGTSDLEDDEQSLESLEAEANLFNAQQALNEIDLVMEQLNSERQRLEADAEAVAARQREAQERIQGTLGAGGLPAFQNFAMVNPLTQQQAVNQFGLTREEEEALNRQSGGRSPFSQSLGVIRVG